MLKVIKENSIFFSNIFSLYFLQIVNAIFPLVVMPYLISVLGMELFGRFSFLTGISVFFGVLVGFGLDTSATRDLSGINTSRQCVNNYVSKAILSRLLIFFVVLVFAIIFSFFISTDSILLFFIILSSSLQSLFPLWLFQGFNKFGWLAPISFFGKLVSFILIIGLVKESGDIIWVPISYSVGSLAVLSISFLVMKFSFGIKFIVIPIEDIRVFLYERSNIFISTFFSNVYRSGIVVIVGFFSGDLQAGVYASAERIIKVAQVGINTIGLAVFPSFTRSIKNGTQTFATFNKVWGLKILAVLFVILVIFNLVLYFILYYSGFLKPEGMLLTFQVMSFVLLFGGMNYYYGYLGLLTSGKDSYFSQSIVFTGVISIIFAVLFSYLYGAVGGALAFTVSEFILMALLYKSIFKVAKPL